MVDFNLAKIIISLSLNAHIKHYKINLSYFLKEYKFQGVTIRHKRVRYTLSVLKKNVVVGVMLINIS